MRQATYGTIKFGTYYSLKRLVSQRTEEEDVRVNVCCAVVAGMVSSAIANPTDVLKVRMQVLGKQSQRGVVACFQDVYRQEGIAGLWRVSVLPFTLIYCKTLVLPIANQQNNIDETKFILPIQKKKFFFLYFCIFYIFS